MAKKKIRLTTQQEQLLKSLNTASSDIPRQKSMLEAKIADIESIQQLTLYDIENRFALFRLDWQALPDAVINSLKTNLISAAKEALLSQRIEYQRQAGKHPAWRQLYVSHWQAWVLYTYVPAQDEPGLPGVHDQIDILHVFVQGKDLAKLLPAHCLEELEEEISREENSK